MKCAICKREIQKTFLNKIKGNYIWHKGKLYVICNECMSKLRRKEEIVKKL